ncbi:MAG TPA: terminase large subunit [Actinomycetes bacterium]|nr:terminase large subunit [Actinomycetes bacterium]
MTAVTAAAIKAGDGGMVGDFIAEHCRITKESYAGHAGELLELRPWQTSMLGRLFARDPRTHRRSHRFGLIGVPRKNGKTAIIAGVGLYGLLVEDPGAEVYAVAGDRDQARLVFGTAKRMVELDAELAGECKLYRDAIEHPSSGSVFRVLSADAPLKEGLSPTLTVVDEVHVINEDLWNVFALAMGARTEPIMVGITTAGTQYGSQGRETICYRMFEYGRRLALGETTDSTFYFEWWGAPEDADYRSPDTWRLANPGYGDILDPADLVASIGPTEEHEFRTKRLNQWVVAAQSVFPSGAWDACGAPEIVVDGPVVLGFDGSWTGDSTAIIGATVGPEPHLFSVAAWERDPTDIHWRVDAGTVGLAMAEAVERYDVVEIACDPYEWREQISLWQERGWPVTEWPNTLARTVPTWKEFYSAVMEKRLSHDADPGLARHVANAVLKVDHRGARPTKEHGSSGRKIDRLIAGMIAFDRARTQREPDAVPEFFAL